MKTFEYRARNPAGRIIEGSIRAVDERDVHARLEAEGVVPVAIRPAAGRRAEGLRVFRPKVRAEEMIFFTRQLSTLLKAGMPILQAMDVMRRQTRDRVLKDVLEAIARRITGGFQLSAAMAEFPHVFSEEYVSVVVSGESGGDLVEALLGIAAWMERELETRTEIRSAIRYPVMVLFAMVAAATIMVTFVIPRFAMFFSRANVPLPLPTRMLVLGNLWLQSYWPFLVGGLAALGTGIVVLLRIPAVRLQYDALKLHLPVTGALYEKILVSRFARVFSMLIRTGVPVIRALEIAPHVMANTALKQAVRRIRQNVETGNSVSESFEETGIFPPLMTGLMAIGEKTGSLDEMMNLMAAQYDMDIKYALKNLTTMIEPIVTVIMGAGVLFLALATFLPIWNLVQVVKP